MELIVGKTAGFCYGVNNAVNKTLLTLEENQNSAIYCLGELVHNKQVVEKLEKLGLKVFNDISDVPMATQNDSKIVIRAHGVSKEVYEKIEQLNYVITDLTCPNVLNIHKIVKKYIEEGFYVFLIGQKSHPEVIGTHGWCNNNCTIIENEEDIEESILQCNRNKVLVVAQTTFSLEKFNNYVEIIKEKFTGVLEIKNTICNATKLRQEETEELAQKVDFIIIIGGKNSSNTRKLYEISCKQTNSICIETFKELDVERIKKYKRVGIMAGASTPKESIDEVINAMSEA